MLCSWLQDPWLLDLKEKQAITKQEEDGNEGNLEEVCHPRKHMPTAFSKAESHHCRTNAEKQSEATFHVWFPAVRFWGCSSLCEVLFSCIPIWRKKTRVGFRTVSSPPTLVNQSIGFIQLDGYGCNMFQHHGRGVHFDFPVKRKGTFVLVLDCFRGWLSTQQRKANHDIYIYIHI